MKKLIPFFLLSFVFFSCQDDVSYKPMSKNDNPESLCSDPYRINLSDIHKAVSSYAPQKARSNTYAISTKYSESGKPVFHVVNFDDGGFIIFSPTKKVQPILAYSENGHFDIEAPNNPTIIWQEEVDDFIRFSEQLPSDSLESALFQWQQLLFTSSANKVPQKETLSRGDELEFDKYMELQTLVQNTRLEWESKGYHTYSIDEFIGDEEWSEYAQQRAQEAIFPLYEDYWRSFCFIVEHDEIEFNEKHIAIQTKWHQDFPFNRYCYTPDGKQAPAGCVPVAISQIMFYYKYPTSFNWNQISNENSIFEATSSTSLYGIPKLISEVGVKCKAEYGADATGVTRENLLKCLKQYGFDAKFSNSPNIPYIVCGNYKQKNEETDKFETKGHTWIEGGIWSYRSHHYYVCWGITESNRLTDFEQSPDYGLTSYNKYIVWGWGGQYDGWYRTFDRNPSNNQPFIDKKYIDISIPE